MRWFRIFDGDGGGPPPPPRRPVPWLGIAGWALFCLPLLAVPGCTLGLGVGLTLASAGYPAGSCWAAFAAACGAYVLYWAARIVLCRVNDHLDGGD